MQGLTMQEIESSPFQIVRSRDALAAPGSQVADVRVFITEESPGYLVNYLAKLFSQIHTACLASHGIYLGQWGVLMFLWVQDGQTQRELSRQVAVDAAPMARSLRSVGRTMEASSAATRPLSCPCV